MKKFSAFLLAAGVLVSLNSNARHHHHDNFSYTYINGEEMFSSLVVSLSLTILTELHEHGHHHHYYNKELMLAAKDEALLFVASEGELSGSAILADAVADLTDINGTEILSDLEMAQLVVLLAEAK